MPEFELVYILISPTGDFTDTVFRTWTDLCDYLKGLEYDTRKRAFSGVRIEHALLEVVE